MPKLNVEGTVVTWPGKVVHNMLSRRNCHKTKPVSLTSQGLALYTSAQKDMMEPQIVPRTSTLQRALPQLTLSMNLLRTMTCGKSRSGMLGKRWD